jgi:hypothetical protein
MVQFHLPLQLKIVMIQEDEKLLIKDLSARLPYGVKALYYDYIEKKEISGVIDVIYTDHDDGLEDCSVGIGYWKLKLTEIKPYLFPISSLTNEIIDEIYNITGVYDINSLIHIEVGTTFEDLIKIFDILHKHHIDYLGFIDKGLALDATGLNIY